MDSNTTGRNHSTLLVVEILLMLFAGSCSSHEFDFVHGNKAYIFETKKNSADGAEKSCKSSYGGHLPVIRSESSMMGINNGLMSIHKKRTAERELWVGGRTNTPLHRKFHFNGSIVDNGRYCIATSRWTISHRDFSGKYSLFSKECYHPRVYLCEIDKDKFKFYVPHSIGHCRKGTKVASGTIAMTAKDCRSMGGRYEGSSRTEQIVNCYFDWCGSEATVTSGIVSASLGRCRTSPSKQGLIQMYAGYCQAMGGRMLPPVSKWRYTRCQLDWCPAGKENFDTFAATTIRACSNYTYAGDVLISMQAGDCRFIGGGVSAEMNDTQVTLCTLSWCRLGRECKRTAHGKEFNGTLSRTISNTACQRWDRQYPNRHSFTNPALFPDASLAEAGNKCRNPTDWIGGPWCFTQDPRKQWEECDIPFCDGLKAQFTEFRLGVARYIFIPGTHINPNKYCSDKYGATFMRINSRKELLDVSKQLGILRANGKLLNSQEIWIEGTTHVRHGMAVTNMRDIGDTGIFERCLVLSAWNPQTQRYDAPDYKIYGQECQRYKRNFICELYEMRMDGLHISGGKEATGIDDLESCAKSCTGLCQAIEFKSSTSTCFHHLPSTACMPGYSNNDVIYIQKAECDCNQLLVNGPNGVTDDDIAASGSFDGWKQYREIHSPSRARLNSVKLVTPRGTFPGAWCARAVDTHQWIQVNFSQTRDVYGVVTQGRQDVSQWVESYMVSYSLDCTGWERIKWYNRDKVFTGNKDRNTKKTQIFEHAVQATCIRIIPTRWHSWISMRFDIIGCLAVRKNLAMNKPTRQVSTRGVGASKLAVDGFLFNNFNDRHCSGTSMINSPWWAVDLVRRYKIREVYVFHEDASDRNERTMSVKIGNDIAVSNNGFWKTYVSCSQMLVPAGSGGSTLFKCTPPSVGQILLIVIPNVRTTLTLCEVQVFGEPASSNIALRKTATQSSTSSNGLADRAVDGHRHPGYPMHTCTHTTTERNPWWSVDLGAPFFVEEVVITNRGDCCWGRLHDFFIDVSATPPATTILKNQVVQHGNCASVKGSLGRGETRSIMCNKQTKGRYVTISIPGASQILTLCEVQVYGEAEVFETYGGNVQHAGFVYNCRFPFTYNKTKFSECVQGDKGKSWCAVGDNYEVDGLWAYCQDIRLVAGRMESEGRLEVLHEGIWKTVCDDGISSLHASLICQQLGYTAGKVTYPPVFGRGSGAIYPLQFNCSSSHTSLRECPSIPQPLHCDHSEDVGISCKTSDDGIQYVGMPTIKRQSLDDITRAIIIPQPFMTISIPNSGYGLLLAWNVYLEKSQTEIALQVWRIAGGVDDNQMILVGQNHYVSLTRGLHNLRLQRSDTFKVQSGDVLGYRIYKSSSIPYDNDYSCNGKSTVYWKGTGDIKQGVTITFQRKLDKRRPCKIYSFNAEILPFSAPKLRDISYDGNLYTVIRDKTSYSSSRRHCADLLGTGADLTSITSAAENAAIRNHLLGMGVSGSFWIGGRTDRPLFYHDWGECEPKRGKNCIVLSNELASEADLTQNGFLWYSASCTEQHGYICELSNKTDFSAEATTSTAYERGNVTASSQITAASRSTAGWTITLLIVLLIAIALVMVAILLIYREKKRKATQEISSPPMSALRQITEHDDFGIENPLFDTSQKENEDKSS